MMVVLKVHFKVEFLFNDLFQCCNVASYFRFNHILTVNHYFRDILAMTQDEMHELKRDVKVITKGSLCVSVCAVRAIMRVGLSQPPV